MKKQTKVHVASSAAKDTQYKDTFERKSSFNEARDTYAGDDGTYHYVTDLPVDLGKRDIWVRQTKTIEYTEKTATSIIAMDLDDLSWDRLEEAYQRSKDMRVENMKMRNADAANCDSDDEFAEDPIDVFVGTHMVGSGTYELDDSDDEEEDDLDDDEEIDVTAIDFTPDRHGRFSEETMRKLKKLVHRYIRSLDDEQRRLLYLHLTEMIPLEELRRIEEERTGEEIKKQTYHKRFTSLLDKGAKYCGTVREKKQIHKTNTEN